TGRDVRRNHAGEGTAPAWLDRKIAWEWPWVREHLHPVDSGEWGSTRDLLQERLELVALGLYLDLAAPVPDKTPDPEPGRRGIHEWPEGDTLHDSTDLNPSAPALAVQTKIY